MGDSSRTRSARPRRPDAPRPGVRRRHRPGQGRPMARGAALMLRYRVTGRRDVPAHDEQLEIDGRAFRLSRRAGSRRRAVRGHAAAGGEPLDQRSRTSPASTRRAPSRRPALRPRRSRRPTDAGSTSATWRRRRPVGPISAVLRGLLDGLTDRPLAAVALEVADDGTRARSSTVERADRGGRVRAADRRAAWQGYYEPRGPGNAGRWTCRRGTVGPGSNMTSRSRTAFPPATLRVAVAVDFALRAHDEWRRVGVVRVPDRAPEASRSVD